VGREKDFRLHEHLVEQLRHIEGLAFFDASGTLVMTTPQGPRLSVTELEAEELNYLLVTGLIRQDKVLQLATSRGCPNNCVFCSKIHGSTWRGWSASKILRELARIRECSEKGELPSIEVIAFEDDDFLVDRARTLELSRGIVEGNFTYDYIIQSNPDTLFLDDRPDSELLDALKAMRTKIIYLGTDSLQTDELRRLGKPIVDVEKIRALSRELHARDLMTSHYLILANLETTADDFLENIFTASQFKLSFNQSFYVNLSLIPVVGSRFFRRVVEEKVPYAYIIEPAEGHPEFNYPIGVPVDPADPLLLCFYTALQKLKGLDKNDPLALFSAFGTFQEMESTRFSEGKSRPYPVKKLEKLRTSYEDMKAQLGI
jgi:hypothetical protein